MPSEDYSRCPHVPAGLFCEGRESESAQHGKKKIMNTTIENSASGLKNRIAQRGAGGGKRTPVKHRKSVLKDSNQPELFGLIWRPFHRPFRLRVGDVIRYDNRLCRVIRVTECSAVVLINRKLREFETRFRGSVRFLPSPAIIRISPHSETEILNRKRP